MKKIKENCSRQSRDGKLCSVWRVYLGSGWNSMCVCVYVVHVYGLQYQSEVSLFYFSHNIILQLNLSSFLDDGIEQKQPNTALGITQNLLCIDDVYV